MLRLIGKSVERTVADEAAKDDGRFLCLFWLVLQRLQEHIPTLKFPNAVHRCVPNLPAFACRGAAAPFAVLARCPCAGSFQIRHKPYLPRHKTLRGKESSKLRVGVRDEVVAITGELRSAVRGEIQAEAEENVGVLSKLPCVGFIANGELPSTGLAFAPSIGEAIELRSNLAGWTQDMTGRITRSVTHLLLHMREDKC